MTTEALEIAITPPSLAGIQAVNQALDQLAAKLKALDGNVLLATIDNQMAEAAAATQSFSQRAAGGAASISSSFNGLSASIKITTDQVKAAITDLDSVIESSSALGQIRTAQQAVASQKALSDQQKLGQQMADDYEKSLELENAFNAAREASAEKALARAAAQSATDQANYEKRLELESLFDTTSAAAAEKRLAQLAAQEAAESASYEKKIEFENLFETVSAAAADKRFAQLAAQEAADAASYEKKLELESLFDTVSAAAAEKRLAQAAAQAAADAAAYEQRLALDAAFENEVASLHAKTIAKQEALDQTYTLSNIKRQIELAQSAQTAQGLGGNTSNFAPKALTADISALTAQYNALKEAEDRHTISLKSATAQGEIGRIGADLLTGSYGRAEKSLLALGNYTGFTGNLVAKLGEYGAAAALSVGALATAIGIVSVAAFKGAEAQEKLNEALILTNDYSGLTSGALKKLAEDAGSSGANTSIAVQSFTALAGAGTFTKDQIELIGPAMSKLASISSVTVASMLKDYEAIAKDPVAAITELDDKQHFLTETQKDNIVALVKQGDTIGAVSAATKAYAQAQEDATTRILESQGSILKGYHSILDVLSQMANAILKVGAPKTPQDDNKFLQAQLDQAKALAASGQYELGINAYTKYTADLQVRIDKNNQTIAAQNKTAADQGLVEQKSADAKASDAKEEAFNKSIRDNADKRQDGYATAYQIANNQNELILTQQLKAQGKSLDAIRQLDTTTGDIAKQGTARALSDAQAKNDAIVKLAQANGITLVKTATDIAAEEAKVDAKYKDPKGRSNQDAYNAQIQENALAEKLYEVKAKTALLDEQQQNKSGNVGDLELAQFTKDQADALSNQKILQDKADLAVAQSAKDRLTAQTKYNNDILVNQEQLVQNQIQLETAKAAIFDKIDQDLVQSQAKSLKEQGDLVGAFNLQFEASYGTTISKIQSDLQSVEDGNPLGLTINKVLKLYQELDALSQQKYFGGIVAESDELNKKVTDLVKSFDTSIKDTFEFAKTDGSLSAAFGAAQLASDIQGKAIPELEKFIKAQRQLYAVNPSTAIKQNLDTAISDLQKMKDVSLTVAKTISDSWKKTGTDISTALTAAFAGKTFTAGLTQITTAYTTFRSGMTTEDQAYATARDAIEKDANRTTDQAQADELALTETYNQTRIQDSLDMFATMIQGAEGFFKKDSDGYKLMADVEKTVRLAELVDTLGIYSLKADLSAAWTAIKGAEAAKDIALGKAVTIDDIANSEASASASGIAGVAKAIASLPFPYDLIAGGAILAALVGVGVKMSGGLGGGGGSVPLSASQVSQAQNGTGTVLGSSTTQSTDIAKSIALLASNSNITTPLSQLMLDQLTAINDGINGVSASISNLPNVAGSLANTAAINTSSGGFFTGKNSTSLTEQGLATKPGQTVSQAEMSGIIASAISVIHSSSEGALGGLLGGGSSSNVSQFSALPTSILSGLTQAISGMQSSVVDAVNVLGGSSAAKTASSNIGQLPLNLGDSAGNIDFLGMTADQRTAALQAAFSTLGDQMATAVVSGIDLTKFSQNGEGAEATLVRVASGVDDANSALLKFNISAINYTDIINTQGDVGGEIVRQSIENVQSISNVVQTAFGTQIQTSLSGIGQIMSTFPGTASQLATEYSSLLALQAQMKETGLGTNLNSSLIAGAGGESNLASGLTAYFNNYFTTAQHAAAETQAVSDQFTALGLKMPATRDGFVNLVNSIGTGSDAASKLTGQVLNLADAFNTAQTDSGLLTTAQLASAKAALDVQLLTAQGNTLGATALQQAQALAALDPSLRAEQQAIYDATVAQTAYNASLTQLTTNTSNAKTALQDAYNAQAATLNTAITNAQAFQATIQSISNTLYTSATSPLTGQALVDASKAQYEATLTAANSGDTTAQGNLSGAVTTLLTAQQSTAKTSADYAMDVAKVGEDLTSSYTVATQQLNVAQAQLDALNASVQGLLTISTGVDDVVGAINALEQAQAAQAVAQLQGQAGANGVPQTTTEAQALAFEQANGQNPTGAPASEFSDWTAVIGDNLHIPGLVDALGQNQTNPAGSTPLNASQLSTAQSASTGQDPNAYATQLAAKLAGYLANPASVPSHASGLTYVPYDDYMGNLHAGEAVVDAPAMAAMRRYFGASGVSNSGEVTAAIKQMTRTMSAQQTKIAKSTYRSAQTLRQFDGDGLPDSRGY